MHINCGIVLYAVLWVLCAWAAGAEWGIDGVALVSLVFGVVLIVFYVRAHGWRELWKELRK